MPPATRPPDSPAARQQALEVHAETGMALCAAIRERALGLGLPADCLGDQPRWADARFTLKTDPFSQEVSLNGAWQDGSRFGSVTLFTDGRVFAEYQILAPHPRLPGQFIEAISVWGRAGAFKSEAVLLEMP